MLHISPGAIIPLQFSNETNFKNMTGVKSLKDMENFRTDLGISLNPSMKAKGEFRYDGGETMDMTLYNEIKFEAVGKKPFYGANTMEITFNVTSQKSVAPKTQSQNLGDILIYNSNFLGFVEKTKATLTTKDGNIITLTPKVNQKMNLTRLSHDGKNELFMPDIKSISLKAY
jgi:predicted lactoylglutathione lyase